MIKLFIQIMIKKSINQKYKDKNFKKMKNFIKLII